MSTSWKVQEDFLDNKKKDAIVFNWKQPPREEEKQISAEEKQEIRAELEQYASTHGIPIEGNHSVKIGLLHDGTNLWVSQTGGTSVNPNKRL